MKKLSNFNKRKKLIFNILNQYFLEFIKFNTSIKIVDKKDYYIIYFLDKEFFYNNLNRIDTVFNNLNNIYGDKLFSISKDIVYGYMYNFYINYADFENDVKNGLCLDLTNKFIMKFNKPKVDYTIELSSIINNDEIVNDNLYNYTLKINDNFIDDNFCIKVISKKYKSEKDNFSIGDLNGSTTAA